MIKATAFILIGGKSERFGSPKWKAILNGKLVLDHIWDACGSFENQYIIGKEKPVDLKKPFIQDALEMKAPVNGLYTALKNTTTDWILLLSCDLPLITPTVFEKLWELKSETCDAIVPTANDKTQVTCGFYNKRILSKLESEIQNSNYSIFKLMKKLNTTYVDFGKDNQFLNMNTKADLEKISFLIH